MVASSNTALSQATILEAGQQLVVAPGEPPPAKPESLDAPTLSALGGCLVDFHEVSLQADRKEMHQREAETISESDAATADLPVVALADSPSGETPGDVGDSPVGPEVYPPTSVNPLPDLSDDGPQEPCPGGFPCEGGDF
jgi:hypothetical protein